MSSIGSPDSDTTTQHNGITRQRNKIVIRNNFNKVNYNNMIMFPFRILGMIIQTHFMLATG